MPPEQPPERPAESPPGGEVGRGKRVGRYLLRERIGRGTWADVYRASEGTPRREVALKILRGGLRPESSGRFGLEIEVLARLQHPGIAAVHEAGVTPDGRAYYSMELVRGDPLLEWSRAVERDARTCLELFARICDSMDHAHRLGIVHRDLKSANILVTDEGHPKVLDFGSARMLDEATDQHGLTGATDIVGSLACVAPEQAAGIPADARADVWALGALLQEALSGSPPHDLRGCSVQEVLKLKTMEPRRLSHHAPALRGDIERVVARALAVDPRERYATAGDLAEDLHNLLHDREVRAHKDGLLRATSRLVRRHRGLAMGVGLVIAAMVLGTIAARIAWLHAERVGLAVQQDAEELLRLSDRHRLDELVVEAESLWPCRPESEPAMGAWLERAQQLSARLPLHVETLTRWEAEANAGPDLSSATPAAGRAPSPGSSQDEHAWRLEKLRDLVEALRAFTLDAMLPNGVFDVRRRLTRTRELVQASAVDAAEAWRTALASIADAQASPVYAGLQLPVHIGLVPIGRDPDSGLWEFAHLESGTVPVRDADGRLILDDDSAVVLVLIPGGRLPGQEDVTLEPFFLSKDELTQAQWIMLAGSNPSYYLAGWEIMGEVTTLRNPVESISWHGTVATLSRAGLSLPTSDQWEYAARAGVPTLYPGGDEPACLKGHANLRDLSAVEADQHRGRTDTSGMLRDGFAVPTRVGSFAPNAFGLRDVLGNVGEYVREATHSGEGSPRAVPHGTYRGGSFFELPAGMSLGQSSLTLPGKPARTLGVRPMLPCEPRGGSFEASLAASPPDR